MDFRSKHNTRSCMRRLVSEVGFYANRIARNPTLFITIVVYRVASEVDFTRARWYEMQLLS